MGWRAAWMTFHGSRGNGEYRIATRQREWSSVDAHVNLGATTMSKSSVMDTLRRVPLFNDLLDDELSAIARNVVRRHLTVRTMLFAEGDPCRELFVVESGAMKLLKTARNGRQQLLSIERAGSALAVGAVFDAGRYSTTAESIDDTSVLSLDASQFRGLCSQHSGVAMKVIRVLGHRLRHLEALIESLSFSTVRSRLAAHLIQLAFERSQHVSGTTEIAMNENNEQLAVRLGTVRELISRNLGQLHGEGLIVMSRKRITIPNLDALKREID
jgi:CRP-like cAMP-binding protein